MQYPGYASGYKLNVGNNRKKSGSADEVPSGIKRTTVEYLFAKLEIIIEKQ